MDFKYKKYLSILKKHSNLSNISELYILSCETLFSCVHAGINSPAFMFHITIKDLFSLNGYQWLTNFIVDVCLTATLYENGDESFINLPCQLNKNCFNNEEVIKCL